MTPLLFVMAGAAVGYICAMVQVLVFLLFRR